MVILPGGRTGEGPLSAAAAMTRALIQIEREEQVYAACAAECEEIWKKMNWKH